jgi:hypothetical protein
MNGAQAAYNRLRATGCDNASALETDDPCFLPRGRLVKLVHSRKLDALIQFVLGKLTHGETWFASQYRCVRVRYNLLEAGWRTDWHQFFRRALRCHVNRIMKKHQRNGIACLQRGSGKYEWQG